jgi:branched-chain amino acid transport system ATP-binding protein
VTAQLEVRDLAVRYGQALAVRGVSFGIERGETLAVVGANGGGKSSLGKAVARLVGSTGDVLLDGTPVPRTAVAAVGAGVVYVPEGRMVFTQLSVADNLRRRCTSGCPGSPNAHRCGRDCCRGVSSSSSRSVGR